MKQYFLSEQVISMQLTSPPYYYWPLWDRRGWPVLTGGCWLGFDSSKFFTSCANQRFVVLMSLN